MFHCRPSTFPPNWPWIWGLDFSHAGMSASAHPFAAVLGCWSRDDGDVIYLVHALKLRRMLPAQHVHEMRKHPCWDAPCAWPHDGNNRSFESGATFADTCRKLGLKMLSGHARFAATNDYNFESGIAELETRFATGRLKIAEHLVEVWEEYRGYHRVNGLVHKVDDDLMSALRVLCMDVRRAKMLGPRFGQPGAFAYRPPPQTARGINDWDIWTGEPF